MQKVAIRELYKQKRKELSPNEIENRSQLISSLLFKNFQLSEKIVSLFLPIERHHEINTYLILEKGISIDARIALPKMNEETQTLRHILFESQSQLEVNRFGIPEPKFGKSIKIKDIHIVLVPLLSFDKNGHRVGYGKGYYDKFLRKCSPTCIFIGLSLFEEMEEISDAEPHDIALHYCITPSKILRFNER